MGWELVPRPWVETGPGLQAGLSPVGCVGGTGQGLACRQGGELQAGQGWVAMICNRDASLGPSAKSGSIRLCLPFLLQPSGLAVFTGWKLDRF